MFAPACAAKLFAIVISEMLQNKQEQKRQISVTAREGPQNVLRSIIVGFPDMLSPLHVIVLLVNSKSVFAMHAKEQKDRYCMF